MSFETALWIGIGLTLLVFFGVGLYSKRNIEGDSENYFVGGRRLTLLVIAGSLMTQVLDANATLGSAQLSEEFGFWAGASLPVGLAVSLFLIGTFLARPMNKREYLTIIDFYRDRYGRTTELVASGFIVVVVSLLLAGNLVAAGLLLDIFLGVDFTLSVVAVAVIISVYIMAGGLFAVAHTDVLQVAVLSIGSIGLLGYVAVTAGVPTPAGGAGSAQLTRSSEGALINWATIFALGLGNIVAVDLMERIFAADTPAIARRACYLGGLGAIVVGVPFSLVAVAVPDILAASGASAGETPGFYVLLESVVPPSLGVLVAIAIFAAAISTGDGAILGASTVLSRNVLEKRPDRGTARSSPLLGDDLLNFTRIVTPLVALVGVGFALSLPAPGTLLVLAFDVSLAALIVPFVLGLYWRWGTQRAAVAAMLCGATTRLVLFVLFPTIYGVENTLLFVENDMFTPAMDGLPTFASPLVALLVYLFVTAVTNRS